MDGRIHEIRDPIHVFIRLDSDEREVLDSPPVQRLREIHQLALTYLVYPGGNTFGWSTRLSILTASDARNRLGSSRKHSWPSSAVTR